MVSEVVPLPRPKWSDLLDSRINDVAVARQIDLDCKVQSLAQARHCWVTSPICDRMRRPRRGAIPSPTIRVVTEGWVPETSASLTRTKKTKLTTNDEFGLRAICYGEPHRQQTGRFLRDSGCIDRSVFGDSLTRVGRERLTRETQTKMVCDRRRQGHVARLYVTRRFATYLHSVASASSNCRVGELASVWCYPFQQRAEQKVLRSLPPTHRTRVAEHPGKRSSDGTVSETTGKWDTGG